MNILKNLFKKLLSKKELNSLYLVLKDWLLSINSVKVIAVIVLNCFLLTAVYGQAVVGVLENQRATEQFKQIFEDFDVLYNYGKISSAKYKGSDKVVINIQDLHNNAEVQKNINNIISLFDEKYGVNNIYLVGAYGQVSTKWLTAPKDKKIREKVIETLLESGKLTGAEYYSAVKNKTEIIKGLEKKEEYFDNLKRFESIIENSPVITMHIEAIKETVKKLQSKYYNKQQKEIEKLSQKYELEQISADEYFEKMEKYAKNYAMNIDKYKNLSGYMDLMDRKKNLDYEKINKELQTFVATLKERIPYNVYKALTDATKNFLEIDKLYGYIIRLSKQYNLELSGNFKELERFFEYIELSQTINPFELMKEKQNFKDELNDKFSVNKVEQEVIFLSNFVGYYEDYLTGKITAPNYEYYKSNIEKFKYIWIKYIDNREIVALEKYEKISDEFYKINIARNKYFIENMKEVMDAKKLGVEVKGKDEIQKSMNSLKKSKEIYITVTGGFHTQEMSKMLSKAGITNIIITPSVTTDTKESDEIHYNLAKEQAKIAFQTLATLPPSQQEVQERVKEFLSAIQTAGLQDIKAEDLQEIIDEVLDRINVDRRKNNEANVSVTINSVTGAEVTVGDKTYEVKADNNQQKVNKENNLYKSKSVLGLMKVSIAMSILTLMLIPISGVTGSFPIVPIILFGLSFGKDGFEWKQYSLLNEGAQKISSDAEIKSNIAESQSAFSDDNDSKELKNRINKKFADLGFEESNIKNIEIGDFTEKNEMKKDEFANVDVRKQRLKTGFLHINYRLIQKIFMDGTNFKNDIWNDVYFSMFIAHELRHRNHPRWHEVAVSFFDIFYFITVFVRELKKRIRELIKRMFVKKEEKEVEEIIAKELKEWQSSLKNLKQKYNSKSINDNGEIKDNDLKVATERKTVRSNAMQAGSLQNTLAVSNAQSANKTNNNEKEVKPVIIETNPLTETIIDEFDNKKIVSSKYEQNENGMRNIIIYFKDGDVEKSVKLLTKDQNLIKPEDNTNISVADWIISKTAYLETKINFNSDRTDIINYKKELTSLNGAKISGIEYDKNNNRIIIYHRKEKSHIKMAYFSLFKALTSEQKSNLESLNNSDNIIGNNLVDWIHKNKDIYGIRIEENGIRSLTELAELVGDAKIKNIECYREDKTKKIKIEISYVKEQDGLPQVVIFYGPTDKEGKEFEKLKKYNVDLPKKPDIGRPIVSWILGNRKSLKIDIEKIDEIRITGKNKLDSFINLSGKSNIEGIEYYQDNNEKKIIAYYKEKNTATGNKRIKGVVFSVSKDLTAEQKAKLYTETKNINSLSDLITNIMINYGIKLKKQLKINRHGQIFTFKNNKVNKTNYDISYQNIKLLSIKDNKITIENPDKIKNVYLNLETEDMAYYYDDRIQDFYNKNSKSLKNFITENDIDTTDFFIRVALNKAILDFVNEDIENVIVLSDKNKGKLKEYFFSNLISILDKGNTNNFIKNFSKIDYKQQKLRNPFYTYNNYFFKFSNNIKEFRLLKNEYDFYNKIKGDKELNKKTGKNINEYYGCFDKEINNKKYKFVVSKNLTKDNRFESLDKSVKNNNFTKKQCTEIIKQVLKIHSDLEEKGLYNYDLNPQSIMIDKDLNIKLIDCDGIVPKDCTGFVSSYILPYDYFLADENLRSYWYDYVKFTFVVNVFFDIKNLDKQMATDFKRLQYIIDYMEKNKNKFARRKNRRTLARYGRYLRIFSEISDKYANFFEQFKLDKTRLDKIKDIVKTSVTLFLHPDESYNKISILELQEIDSNLLMEKEKDSVYVIKNIVIDKSNKLVRVYNDKFIKKREKGDWVKPDSWYYNLDSKKIVFYPILYKFTEYVQKYGTILQKIVDESIPIDDTDIFQKLVLGTLIKNFIDENTDSNIKDDNKQNEFLYKKLKTAGNIKKYFGKDAFKKVFMQIIEADSELLKSFFNFNEECKLIKDKKDDKKFYLNFSSGLKLELSNKDLNKITDKFPKVKVDEIPKEKENIPPSPPKSVKTEKQIKTDSHKVEDKYMKVYQKIKFVSPIENIKFSQISENYQKLFAIQIPVVRDKYGKILTDDKNNKIKLKLNVVYTKENGISYYFTGQSEGTVKQLIRNGKLSEDLKELKPLVDLLFIDRYSADKNLREEIENKNLLWKEQIKALSDYAKKDEDMNYYEFKCKLIGQGYTFTEIEQILSDIPGRTNTYVGLKDVELKLTNQLLDESKIIREIQRLKRAGIHKVVLLKDKDVSNKELYIIIEIIRKSGLQPIIGLTREMLSVSADEKSKVYDFIEESIKIKALSGFRFMFDIDEKVGKLLNYKKDIYEMISILDLIMNIGKEISYKPSNFNNEKIDIADELFKGKVIYVVAGKQFTRNNEEDLVINRTEENSLKKLAGEGRLSLYFDIDKDNLKVAKALIERIFGKGTDAIKTMISLGTTFTANMFAGLFKKDSASKGFSNAYEIGYEPIFGDISPDIVAVVFKDVLTDNMNFNEFLEYEQREKEQKSKKTIAFTKEFDKLVIEDIKEVSKYNISEKEQTAMLKQYVIGFLMSYIETHFDELYEVKRSDKMIDIKQMDINVRNQIMYRILLLLLKEMIFNNIKQYVSIKDSQKEGSMKQSVNNIKNNELSVNISKMLMKTNININSVLKNNIDTIAICNDINVLLEYSLLPVTTNELSKTGNLIKDIKNIVRKASY